MADKTDLLSSQAMLGEAIQGQRESSSKERAKMNDLAFIDNEVLFSCTAVFPFDFFPDSVLVDRTKITIIHKLFFFTQSIQSILIQDLLTIVVRESVMFASLEIVDRLFPKETITIDYLPKTAANTIRRIIEGLILADRQKIDLTQIPRAELIKKLEKIGKTKQA